MEAGIRAALKEHVVTQTTNITIESRRGKMTLRGNVLTAEERTEAEKIAADAPGG
nr:BON domain-containing protein [Polaromonas sp. UBA4122]